MKLNYIPPPFAAHQSLLDRAAMLRGELAAVIERFDAARQQCHAPAPVIVESAADRPEVAS